MTFSDDYYDYVKTIEKAIKDPILTFKSDPMYKGILEHVDFYQGLGYLDRMGHEFGLRIQDIAGFIALNDAIGYPDKYSFSHLNLTCSPTSLRYVYHAHLVLTHIRSLYPQNDEVDIVEIGGGYGGLCLAIHYFAPKFGVRVRSYSIIDILEVTMLQKRYLMDDLFHDVIDKDKLSFHDASYFGKDVTKKDVFMISNYAYSELSMDFRVQYTKDFIVSNVKHGFMVWNNPLHDFGVTVQRVEVERPQTGIDNRFVYF